MYRRILAIGFCVVACSTEKILESAARFTIAPRNALIHEGALLQMKPLVSLDGPVISGTLTWKSSAPEVASVDANGLVTALAPGRVTITAVSDTIGDSTLVTIQGTQGKTLTASGNTTCGITPSAAVCWGQNTYSQTGAATTPSTVRFTPTAVPAAVRWRSLDAGWNHTCGVDTLFDIYCWGLNNVGQLGMGTESESVIPSKKVASELKFVQVSAGGAEWQTRSDTEILTSQTTCGLTRASETYCWGRMGDFATTGETQTNTPRAVAPGLLFASISVGNAYACGISIERRAYCWGNNDLGQLGRAHAQFDRGVRRVDGNIEFEQISAGGIHACALTGDGTAYCWGVNESQQLGAAASEQCSFQGRVVPCATHPIAVNTTHKFKSISAGSWGISPNPFSGFDGFVGHTCGVTLADDVVCWGRNANNEIWRRLNFDEPLSLPPTLLPFSEKFRAVVAGAFHTCAVLVNNHVWCWGDQSRGQLGVPEGSNTFNSFVEIAGGYVFQ
jgi:hypothetical protein